MAQSELLVSDEIDLVNVRGINIIVYNEGDENSSDAYVNRHIALTVNQIIDALNDVWGKENDQYKADALFLAKEYFLQKLSN